MIAQANDGGGLTQINRYDEYGVPASTNQGRFQYTGQAWLPSIGLYHYKARTYSPTLGRFLQTDPIGYGDGVNWYNYVGGDPVNNVDPTGTAQTIQFRFCTPQVTVSDAFGNFPSSQPSACTTLTASYPSDVDPNFQDLRPEYGNNNPGMPPAKKPQNSRINCNSSARQFFKFAGKVSDYAGGSAVLFGILGAEPAAALFEGISLGADVVDAFAGAYVAYSQGDYRPLLSTDIGRLAGAAGGLAGQVFGSRSVMQNGARVTKGADKSLVKASGFTGGHTNKLVPQVCN